MSTRIVVAVIAVALAIAGSVYLKGEPMVDGPKPLAQADAESRSGTPSSVPSAVGTPSAQHLARAEGRPGNIEELRQRMLANEAEYQAKKAAERAAGAAPSVEAAPNTFADTKTTSRAAPTTTPQEAAVLDLYENMASAFERHADNCREMGIAVSEFVEDGSPALQQLARARSAMSEAERVVATERLERDASEQLERLRQSIRVGLAKCPTEKGLQDAILKLAQLGAETTAPAAVR